MTSPALARTPTQTVQAFLDAFARHDIDAAVALADPRVAVTVHPLGVRDQGADALRQILADLVRGFPDLMISVSRVITTGDVVTALPGCSPRSWPRTPGAGAGGAGPSPTWP